MKIATVVGTVVSTVNIPLLDEHRLLLCDVESATGGSDEYTIAIDVVDAGVGLPAREGLFAVNQLAFEVAGEMREHRTVRPCLPQFGIDVQDAFDPFVRQLVLFRCDSVIDEEQQRLDVFRIQLEGAIERTRRAL